MVKSLLENYDLLDQYVCPKLTDESDRRSNIFRASFENAAIYKADLDAAVSKLDKRQQKLVYLHYIQGYDLSEIAQTSGLLTEELQAIFSRIIRRIAAILNWGYAHLRM